MKSVSRPEWALNARYSAGEQVITGPFKTLRVLKDGDRVAVQKEAETPP